MGFPDGSAVKNLPGNTGNVDLIPGLRRSPRGRAWQPTPVFLPGESHGQRLLLMLLLSRFSRVQLCAIHRRQPTRLPHPWDSPGKNTEVHCHFLLQCMKVKSESAVAQLCLTPSDPMDCSPPGSSVHGIFQARVLGWVAIAVSGTETGRLQSMGLQRVTQLK